MVDVVDESKVDWLMSMRKRKRLRLICGRETLKVGTASWFADYLKFVPQLVILIALKIRCLVSDEFEFFRF